MIYLALFKPLLGKRENLPTNLTSGYAYFCTDDGSFWIDYTDSDGVVKRKQINAQEAERLIDYEIVEDVINDSTLIPTSSAVYSAIEAATEVYVGPDMPTDPNIKVWVNTAEEGGGVVPLLPIITSVNLPASGWTGSNPYSQTVDVPNASSTSMITLQPSAAQILALQNSEISMTVENDGNGVVTFYAIGDIPTSNMTMQILITPVSYV